MKPERASVIEPTQADRLRQHGLAVIDGQQGKTAFRKLVQIRPGKPPAPGVKTKRPPMRR
ncbi:hypothetical protein [Limnohabitans sp.]|uniref:hypothetical protein n=1 Tax=Limnohabitans sp. TaxID=1907725 RepID=UPI00311E8ED6